MVAPERSSAFRLAVVAAALFLPACSSGLGDNLPVASSAASPEPPPTGFLAVGVDTGADLGVELRAVRVQAHSLAGKGITLAAFVTDAPADQPAARPLDFEAPSDSNGADDVFLAVYDDAGEIADVLLVSRDHTSARAGAGPSSQPTFAFQPNPAFTPTGPGAANPAAFVHVAFASAAPLLLTDTNGVSDVYRAKVEVYVDRNPATGQPSQGELDLRLVTGGELARANVRNGIGLQGNGAASAPVLAENGDVVVFLSEDSTIADPNKNGVFNDDANGALDVFVHRFSTTTTLLANPAVGGTTFSAGGIIGVPQLGGAQGRIVAFASSAPNLVLGDTNGVADVFYSVLDLTGVLPPIVRRASVASGGVEAAGGDSRNPSLFVLDEAAGDVLVAFESDKTNLVTATPPATTTSVYLHEGRGARTTLLNQAIGFGGARVGKAAGGLLPADSFRPSFAPDGSAVVFETLADDLDLFLPNDGNGVSDIVLADLTYFFASGDLRIHRLSVGPEGQDADGGSTSAAFGAFEAGAGVQGVVDNFRDGLAAAFRHPRCFTCHSFNTPLFSQLVALPHVADSNCNGCHATGFTEVSVWEAPPAMLSFHDKTIEELCDQAMDPGAFATFEEHLKQDEKILWALEVGRAPNPASPSDPGSALQKDLVPGGSAQFVQLVDAWIAGGTKCQSLGGGAKALVHYRTAAENLGAAPGDDDVVAFLSDRAIERVSKASGFGSASAELRFASTSPVVTADDRYVAFVTAAAVDPRDGNGVEDVYLRDLFLGTTTLVSRAASGSAAGDGPSTEPSVALVAGRPVVAFTSRARNLVTGFIDANGAEPDVFVADLSAFDGKLLATLAVTLVSAATGSPTQGGDGGSSAPALASSSGTFVAFASTARDLVPSFVDGNGDGSDVFGAELGGATVLVSRTFGAATTGANGPSGEPAISRDGQVVAFTSGATNLIASFVDENGDGTDVFLRGRSGPAELVSRNVGAVLSGGNGASSAPALDGLGSIVAFESRATDLVSPFVDANGPDPDVFVRDRTAGKTALASVSELVSGTGADGEARRPSLSPNGLLVAFDSTSTNLAGGGGEPGSDVFVRDAEHALARVSISIFGGAGDGASTHASLGSDSGRVVFTTSAKNLLGGGFDGNGVADVFRIDPPEIATVKPPPPIASFLTSATQDIAPFEVSFTDKSTGSITSRTWSFGDGASSSEKDPTHTYVNPGTFLATLTVEGAGGQGQSTRSLKALFPPPIAVISADKTSGIAPLSVTFTDQSTGSPVLSRNWSFGDGIVQNPGPSPVGHIYGSAGTFKARLTVFGPDMMSDFDEVFIVVGAPPPMAAFNTTIDPDDDFLPISVSFSNTSTGATSFSWNFGDGSPPSTANSPTHSYTKSGTFTVTLTATGPGGSDGETKPNHVTVLLPTFTGVVGVFDPAGAATGKCGNCHPGTPPNTASFSAYVNASGQGVDSSCGSTTKKRVVPGNPGQSYLMEQLNAATLGTSVACGKMPLAGPPLTERELDLVFGWIFDGAKNN